MMIISTDKESSEAHSLSAMTAVIFEEQSVLRTGANVFTHVVARPSCDRLSARHERSLVAARGGDIRVS